MAPKVEVEDLSAGAGPASTEETSLILGPDAPGSGDDAGGAPDKGDRGDAGVPDKGAAGEGAPEQTEEERAAAEETAEAERVAAEEKERAEAAGEGEQTDEEKAAAEAKAATEKDEDFEEEDFHDGKGRKLTLEQALAAEYRKNPKLKEFLKENPDQRYKFFRAIEIGRVFPTVKEARLAYDSAKSLHDLDSLYYGDADAKREFVHALFENDIDEKTGKPDGHFAEVQSIMVGDYLGDVVEKALTDQRFTQAAKEMGIKPEQLRLAAIIMGRAMGAPGFDALIKKQVKAKPGEEGVQEPAESEELAQIRKERAELNAEKQRGQQEAQVKYETGINKDYMAATNELIGKALEKVTGIPAKMRPLVAEKILKEVTKRIQADELFDARIRRMVRSGNRSPEIAEKVVRELKSRARGVVGDVATDILTEYGLSAMRQQTEQEKHAADAQRRREPGSGGGSPGKEKPGGPASKEPSGKTYDQAAREILTS